MTAPRHQRRKEKLLALFASHGIQATTKMGQNFLLDRNQVRFIARQGEVGPEDVVLEVGPGTGFLSQELAPTGATILACEFDHKLAAVARDVMKEYPNFILIEGDILAGKNRINPEVLERLEALVAARGPGTRLKSVSNLPYSAGTPFAANLFSSPLPWTRAAFMLQLEVAERLVAKPGTSAYGNLSIIAALGGKAKIARKVPPQVFWPRPRVASAVVTIDFRPPAERLQYPWRALRRVTTAIFGARRKRLRNALKGVIPKASVDEALERLELDPEGRGEAMAPDRFVALATLVAEEFPEAVP